MNKYDRSQLNFIMSLDDKAFDNWALELTDDDLQYALELIKRARAEQSVQEQELLDAIEDLDLSEANAVLKKFML